MTGLQKKPRVYNKADQTQGAPLANAQTNKRA